MNEDSQKADVGETETEAKAAADKTNTDFTAVLDQNKTQETNKPEISGTAIARMMGVATSTEIKFLESKLDLISGRINNTGVKVDKIISQFQSLPTGSDLERIDVQIGSLKSLIRDLTLLVSGDPATGAKKAKTDPAVKPQNQTEIVAPQDETQAAE